jgi:hypothetical protein
MGAPCHRSYKADFVGGAGKFRADVAAFPDHVIVFNQGGPRGPGEFRTNVAAITGSCDCVFKIWEFAPSDSDDNLTLHSLALSIQCVYVFNTRELRYAI